MSRALKLIQKPFLHCCPPPQPSHLPGTRTHTHTHIAQCRNGPGTQLTERPVYVGFSYSPYACTCVNSERCVRGRGRGCSSDQQWHNCRAVYCSTVRTSCAALRCRSILWLCQLIHPSLYRQSLFSLYPHLLLRPYYPCSTRGRSSANKADLQLVYRSDKIYSLLPPLSKLSRYSDLLRAGRPGDRIPVGTRSSAPVQTGPGAHPASYTMGTRSFPGVKRPGRGVEHTLPSSALCSPFGPSWPVLG
jgi:hypothetical protein